MSKSAGNVVAPQDVIKQSGAEILRLWVAAQDYREDLRISQEILNHLIEAYRKIRNTVPLFAEQSVRFRSRRRTVCPMTQLPELDRWALMRLGELITKVRQSLRRVRIPYDLSCAEQLLFGGSERGLSRYLERIDCIPSASDSPSAPRVADSVVRNGRGLDEAHGAGSEFYRR